MSKLSDKVSYLHGLAEGMKLDQSTNEGKLLEKIIAILGDVSEKLDDLDERYEELSDYVECIDDDLQTLEDGEDEDDDDEDYEDEDDDDDPHFHVTDFDEDENEEEDGEGEEEEDDGDGDEDADELDEDDVVGMYSGCLCSECGGMFSVDAGLDEDMLFICPHCGKKVKAIRMNCTNVPVAQSAQDKGEGGDEEK